LSKIKKALILCASHNDLGMIKALRKLGFYIIATGNVQGLPGEKYADEYIKADYSRKELILQIAKEKQIDVICQCCNDFGVYTAAYVAEQLNLPGYDSYETTLTLHNKDRFKKFAEENGIVTPEAVQFEQKESALHWGEKNAEYPLIVKPVDASAGNGIRKVEKAEELEAAVEDAFAHSRCRRILIEKYITGKQYGFCTFLKNRKVAACCSNNEFSFINPYRVEIDLFPADNYLKVKEVLVSQIEKMAEVLELKDGIFHLQYIMDGNEPRIIEVMRRVLGNMYSVPADMLTGIDWDYWEVRVKCGLSCENMPVNIVQEGYFAYKTILAEKNGVIKAIAIPKKYERYIWKHFLLKKPGGCD
jgi:biotin carboxylase